TFTQIALEAVDASVTTNALAQRLSGTGRRLLWRTNTDGIQKISVSAPCAPGLWLRVTTDDNVRPAWRFVTLETGRSRNLLFGNSKPSGSYRLHYEFNGTAVRGGILPVVFTLTEG
ncbi:MAG: hypothetical protein AABY75_00760, partial [Bacteroidota bacterium]